MLLSMLRNLVSLFFFVMFSSSVQYQALFLIRFSLVVFIYPFIVVFCILLSVVLLFYQPVHVLIRFGITSVPIFVVISTVDLILVFFIFFSVLLSVL